MEEKAAINAAQTITRYCITSITKTEFEIEHTYYSRPVDLLWRNCFSGHAYPKVVYFLIGSLSNNYGRRLGKRHSKSEVALLQTLLRLPISFNSSNVGNFFPEFNSKRLYQSSGKERESRGFAFTSSTKRE